MSKPIVDRVVAKNKIEHIAIHLNFNGTAKTKCGKTVSIPYVYEHRRAESKCPKCYSEIMVGSDGAEGK